MSNGKVALVTGSSTGIGRGVAYALAGAGYDIAVHYHFSEKEALDVVSKLEVMGVKTCLLKGDIGDPDVPEKLVKETVAKCPSSVCNGNGHGAYKWGSTNVVTEDEQGNPVYN